MKPADCDGRFETEGEVVAVIGRQLRRCSRDEAADAVLGWTIGNDVSARDWQHEDRTFWRAKNTDTFKPMGPWIDTEIDPMQSTTTVSVNGEPRATFATGDMIFDALDYICEMTRYLTVGVGDVLWMGTDGVVGMAPGDRVDIHVTGLGTLTNPVHTEAPQAPTKENHERPTGVHPPRQLPDDRHRPDQGLVHEGLRPEGDHARRATPRCC